MLVYIIATKIGVLSKIKSDNYVSSTKNSYSPVLFTIDSPSWDDWEAPDVVFDSPIEEEWPVDEEFDAEDLDREESIIFEVATDSFGCFLCWCFLLIAFVFAWVFRLSCLDSARESSLELIGLRAFSLTSRRSITGFGGTLGPTICLLFWNKRAKTIRKKKSWRTWKASLPFFWHHELGSFAQRAQLNNFVEYLVNHRIFQLTGLVLGLGLSCWSRFGSDGHSFLFYIYA